MKNVKKIFSKSFRDIECLLIKKTRYIEPLSVFVLYKKKIRILKNNVLPTLLR